VKPIHYYSATHLPPKKYSTVQFEMKIVDDAGAFKFNIIGQRSLTKIKEALEIIKINRPNDPPIDITEVESFKKEGVF
jgi:DNA polymerase-3 subunit alpha